ncbi:hypothetical protein D9X30_1696 (plasmid) [Cupriavidus sp. U2]|uniref:DUF1294 domain-containing protein n=1 Tax=Cupriavidus sp. U2 TaxID=2920269 RepID=UPI00129D7390|nr:DUF1294 domain-containing protein [Cupriavidus sp. U2]KAI3593386.1 hypothetical protein D9X30_1696 [Cupriavidus sp. U2]
MDFEQCHSIVTTPRNPLGPAVKIALLFCTFEMGLLFYFSQSGHELFAIMNMAAFVMFAIDKNRALDAQWRIQKSHLHWVTLAGGFAGAQLAKSLFPHKTQKP